MVETTFHMRNTVLVFENIDLVDIETVPGLYPSAQGRLIDYVARLPRRNERHVPLLPLEDEEDPDA